MSAQWAQKEVYATRQWRALRNQVRADAGYLCTRCAKQGRTSAGEIVHHVRPIEQPWNGPAFDVDNLQCVCRRCHGELHRILDSQLPQRSPERALWREFAFPINP